MARYLITHSLLSAWLHLMKGNPCEDLTTERDPMEEFMLTLCREPTPTTEAMQNGIIFEDLVTAILQSEETFGYYEMHDQDGINGFFPADIHEHKWYEAAKIVADRCAGGVLQYKAKKEIAVKGVTFLLYGRLDCLKAGEIIDIKFTESYDVGTYFSSTQHPTYFELVPEARQFTYLASNGRAVWPETYRHDEIPSIYPYISDFMDWLNAIGLGELYKERWLAK